MRWRWTSGKAVICWRLEVITRIQCVDKGVRRDREVVRDVWVGRIVRVVSRWSVVRMCCDRWGARWPGLLFEVVCLRSMAVVVTEAQWAVPEEEEGIQGSVIIVVVEAFEGTLVIHVSCLHSFWTPFRPTRRHPALHTPDSPMLSISFVINVACYRAKLLWNGTSRFPFGHRTRRCRQYIVVVTLGRISPTATANSWSFSVKTSSTIDMRSYIHKEDNVSALHIFRWHYCSGESQISFLSSTNTLLIPQIDPYRSEAEVSSPIQAPHTGGRRLLCFYHHVQLFAKQPSHGQLDDLGYF